MIEEGHDIKEMLFVNFDDERLIGCKASDLDSILKAYSSLYEYKPILFLDEIQNVEGWEHFARRLANQKYRVYITGSNVKMLSKDISTVLGQGISSNTYFHTLLKSIYTLTAVKFRKTGFLVKKEVKWNEC